MSDGRHDQPTLPAKTTNTIMCKEILEAAPLGIAVIDQGQTLIRANGVFNRWFGGRNPGELPGGDYSRLIANAGPNGTDTLAAIQTGLQAVLHGAGQPFEFEVACADAAGLRWLLVLATPLPRAEGLCAVVTHVDITRRKESLQQLAEENTLVNTLLENIPDYVFVKDAPGRYRLANRATRKLFGAEARDFRGATDFDFLPAELAARFLADDLAVWQGRQFLNHEEPVVDPAGRNRLVQTSKLPLHDPQGQVCGLIAISRDITEQKQAEATLRRSEANMALAQRITRFGSWELVVNDPANLNTNPLFWSREAYRIFGRDTAEPVTNEVFLEFVHPEDRERVTRQFAEAVRTGSRYSLDHRIITGAGEVRHVHEEAEVIPAQAGEPSKVVGAVMDITERVLAENLIQRQAALLDHARDTILVKDLEGRVTYWNKGAENLHGWTQAEVLGRVAEDFLYKDHFRAEAARLAILGKDEWSGEFIMLTKTGREVIMESRWTLVRDSAGAPVAILSINSDVTDRRKLEAQYLRAQRLESIGVLAGGIAHDLNNIFAPILMSVQLLRDRLKEPEDAEIMNLLQASTLRGSDLVRQVLSFARGLESKPVALNVVHLAREVQHIINDTFPKNIRIELKCAPDVWTVYGDPTQIHQVLMNLTVNARDAMPHGGLLTVSAENFTIDEGYAAMHPEARPGSFVVLSVTDNGTGIPTEALEKIFDPFFTTKEIGKGTGLGLSTVVGIVRTHRGFLNVYSEPGKGSTFKVYLPADLNPEQRNERREHEERLPRGHNETILVVDDEEAVLRITKRTLEQFGYQTLTAKNGAEAVAVYAQNQPRVAAVITDIMMPVMDGVMTIVALRQMNPAVKVIAASGLGGNAEFAKAANAGVKRFLCKPFTADALLTNLEELLAS